MPDPETGNAGNCAAHRAPAATSSAESAQLARAVDCNALSPAQMAKQIAFAQSFSDYVNRRLRADPDLKMPLKGRRVEVLELSPDGRLIYQLDSESAPEFVWVDAAILDTLLAKII